LRCSPTDFALSVREAPQDMVSGIDMDADGLRYVGHMLPAADIENKIRYLPRWCIEVRALQGGGENASAPESDLFAWTTAALLLPPLGLLAFAEQLVRVDADRAAALRDGRLPGSIALRVVLAEVMQKSDVALLSWSRRTVWTPESKQTTIIDPIWLKDGRLVWMTFGPGQPWRIMQERDGTIEVQVLDGDEARPVFLPHHDGTDDPMVAMWLPRVQRCKLWPAAWQSDWTTSFEVDMTVMPGSWLRHGDWLWVLAPACTSGVKISGVEPGRVVTWDSGTALGDVFRHALHDGRWLTVPTVEPGANGRMRRGSLQWIDLEHALEPVPIGCSERPHVSRCGEYWWFSAGDDVRVGRAGEVPVVERCGFVHAALATEDRLYVGASAGGTSHLEALDLQTRSALWRLDDTPMPSVMMPVPGGIMLASATQFWLIRATGQVMYRSESRRDVTWQWMPDGHFAVAAGEELAIVAPNGALSGTRLMPWGGVLTGIMGDYLLYGPGAVGWDQWAQLGYWLLNHEGDTVAKLPFKGPTNGDYIPIQTRWTHEGLVWTAPVFEDRLIACENQTRSIQEHALRQSGATAEQPEGDSPEQQPRPTWLRSTRENEQIKKWHTTNPRDEWPEAGVVFRQEGATCVDSHYAGTTGVAPGPSVALHDGASVLMVGCTLEPGGIEIHGGSTLWLVHCELGDREWSLGGHGRVVVVNCRIDGQPSISGVSAGGVWRPEAPGPLIVE
jgi:hypothetical protein